MKVIGRWRLGGAVAVVLSLVGTGGMAGAAPLNPQGQGTPVLNASLAPSMPSDASILGVPPGSIPWSIASGQVSLRSDGTVQVEIARLIGTSLGYNPVPYLAATVYCAGEAVGTTATVPFSDEGTAHLRAQVALPATCPEPAVLINPAKTAGTPLGAYIATSTSAMG